MKYVIGIDGGTQSTKVGIYDLEAGYMRGKGYAASVARPGCRHGRASRR